MEPPRNSEPMVTQALQAPYNKFIVTNTQHSLTDASAICKNLNDTLPEIRTDTLKENVRALAITNKIEHIYSGIVYDQTTRTFRYLSDHKNLGKETPFGSKMIYGGDYPDWDYTVDRNSDPTLHSMANRYPIVYSNPLYKWMNIY